MNSATTEVVIVGTGTVSAPVAAAFASTGADTRIAGRDATRAEGAAEKASTLGEARVRPAPLEPTTFAGAALVVECVAEDVAIKRALLKQLEPWLPQDCVLATNTSSLPLDELADGLTRPERFAGLHFLHPAHLTGVVEIVAASQTEPKTVERLLEWAEAQQKRPIVVRRPTPGFVWNRLQFALLRECVALVDEGIADPEAVDAAVSDGLAPRWVATGPLATADLGGIALFREIARQLYPHLSADQAPSESLDRAEAGGGFYAWDHGHKSAAEEARAESLAFASGLSRRHARPRPRDVDQSP
jgi:3-hydroxybutyryl-CoA dehydrogenase